MSTERERPWQVERDRFGVMFSGPLDVGEMIEVVPAAERDRLAEEAYRLRVENTYLKDTSPACAAEAVREKERSDRLAEALREAQSDAAIDRAGDALFQSGLLDEIAEDGDRDALIDRDAMADALEAARVVLRAALSGEEER